jgi:hypothetical protein
MDDKSDITEEYVAAKVPQLLDEYDALLKEYSECHGGYNYRDQLAAQEFYYTVLIISALFGIQQILSDKMGLMGFLFISVIGLFALHILHVDLMSIKSCKMAAITRALEIEEQIGQESPKKILRLAHEIGDRKQLWLEKNLKSLTSSYLIIWFVRILIIIWIAYSAWIIHTSSSWTSSILRNFYL